MGWPATSKCTAQARRGPVSPRSGGGPIGQLAGRGAPQLPEKGTAPHAAQAEKAAQVAEIGGPEGLEPTRYGDWERNGICYDF
jgi:hypothetical protein